MVPRSHPYGGWVAVVVRPCGPGLGSGLAFGLHVQEVPQPLQVQLPRATRCPRTLDTFLGEVARSLPQRGIDSERKETKGELQARVSCERKKPALLFS